MKKSLVYSMVFSTLFGFAFTQAHADPMSKTVEPQAQNGQDTNSSSQQSQGTFMEENKNKPGVVTLPSGLQYKIIKNGTGKKPASSDTVTVDYEGKLLNGKVFDSSYKRGQPAVFPVGAVIAGWQEALQLMPEGSTWMLYIPADLAYGSTGAGGVIGPNETLVFKVHLIKIQ